MLDIKIYAAIMLIMGVISMSLVFAVIKRQVELFKRPIENKRVRHFRRNLFLISLTIILTNLVPVIIDALSLFIPMGRPEGIKPISVVYAMSIHLEALGLSFLLWQMYRLAANEKVSTDLTEERLIAEILNKKG